METTRYGRIFPSFEQTDDRKAISQEAKEQLIQSSIQSMIEGINVFLENQDDDIRTSTTSLKESLEFPGPRNLILSFDHHLRKLEENLTSFLNALMKNESNWKDEKSRSDALQNLRTFILIIHKFAVIVDVCSFYDSKFNPYCYFTEHLQSISEVFEENLSNESVLVQKVSCEGLQDLINGFPREFQSEVSRWANHPNPAIRATFIVYIGSVETNSDDFQENFLPILVKGLNDHSTEVHEAALKTILEIANSDPFKREYPCASFIRERWAPYYQILGSRLVKLLPPLWDKNENPTHSFFILMKTLSHAPQNSNKFIRYTLKVMTKNLINKSRERQLFILEAITQLTKTGKDEVFIEIFTCLVEAIKSCSYMEELGDSDDENTGSVVRLEEETKRALQVFLFDHCVPLFLEGLTHPSSKVRVSAANALHETTYNAKCEGPSKTKFVPVLLNNLTGSDRTVDERALKALESFIAAETSTEELKWIFYQLCEVHNQFEDRREDIARRIIQCCFRIVVSPFIEEVEIKQCYEWLTYFLNSPNLCIRMKAAFALAHSLKYVNPEMQSAIARLLPNILVMDIDLPTNVAFQPLELLDVALALNEIVPYLQDPNLTTQINQFYRYCLHRRDYLENSEIDRQFAVIEFLMKNLKSRDQETKESSMRDLQSIIDQGKLALLQRIIYNLQRLDLGHGQHFVDIFREGFPLLVANIMTSVMMSPQCDLELKKDCFANLHYFVGWQSNDAVFKLASEIVDKMLHNVQPELLEFMREFSNSTKESGVKARRNFVLSNLEKIQTKGNNR